MLAQMVGQNLSAKILFILLFSKNRFKERKKVSVS